MENVNQFILSGLNSDTHTSLSDVSCFYLLNGDITDFTEKEKSLFVQNMSSNKLCVELPLNFKIVGVRKLDKGDVILALKNTVTSAFYIFNEDTCHLREYVTDTCLDFQDDKWVDIAFKKTPKGRVIYFTDDYNSIRYLNIDKHYPRVNERECRECNDILTDRLDCDSLKIFENVTFPGIDIDVIEGNIPNGVYQIAISYADDTQPKGEFFIYSQVLNLHSRYDRRGRKFGLSIKFTDCFKGEQEYYRIALITHREDRQTSVQVVGTYRTSQQEFYITNLDDTSYIPIGLEELLNVGRYYQTAKFIATNSEMLVLGKTTERQPFNYQKQANEIVSEFIVIKVPANEAHKVKSYQRNEVYPHYIQWLYEDGEVNEWTHIPSNVVPEASWLNNATDPRDVWNDDCHNEALKYWEIYNTAQLTAVYEFEDNGYGSEPLSPIYDGTCAEYEFTGNDEVEITVTYEDCYGNTVSVTDKAKNIRICTKSIASIAIDYPTFSIQSEIVDLGGCDTGLPNTQPCREFKLHYKWNDVDLSVTVSDQCSSDIVDPYACTPDTGYYYSGNEPQTIRFCACNEGELNINFDVDVEITEVVATLVGACADPGDGYSDLGDLCDYSVVARGTFAYWESAIKYPNEEGFLNLPNKTNNSICDTGIRYHKFPDCSLIWDEGGRLYPITHIHNNTADCKSREYVYLLGIDFSNIQPPVDCNGDLIPGIIGYRIGVGDRTNNKSVIHNGIIHNMRYEEDSMCNKVHYANYPFNDLNPDFLIQKEKKLKESEAFSWSHTGQFTPLTGYSQDLFQYVSPDVNFNINDNAGDELYIQAEENGYIDGYFSQEERFPPVVKLNNLFFIVLDALVIGGILAGIIGGSPGDALNWIEAVVNVVNNFGAHYNYAFRGIFKSNYSRFNLTNTIIGNRRRRIDLSYFMQSTNQTIEGIKVNNFQRENALLLKLHEDIDIATGDHIERSRVKLGKRTSQGDDYDTSFRELVDGVCTSNFEDCEQDTYKTASYYVSTVRRLPSQYGFITDPIVRPVTDQLTATTTSTILGGDVYITKHTYVKKFPFFTNIPLDGAFNSQFDLSSYGNIGYPTYWMDNNGTNVLTEMLYNFPPFQLISVNELDQLFGIQISFETYHLDKVYSLKKQLCSSDTEEDPSCTDDIPSVFNVLGAFYTHYIGVMHYYCESEFVGDYREYNDIPETQFYPVRDLEDIVKYRTILNPEQFLYNPQQLWKGIPSKYQIGDPNLDCCDKPLDYDEVAFSLPNDNESNSDKWLNFRPRNYHRFTNSDGELTGMDAVDDYNLLFRFENAAYVTQGDDTLVTKNNLQVYLGSGSIFANKMRKLSSEINGFGGSIDRFSFVNTPYGAFWYDQIRKSIIYFDYKSISPANNKLQSWLNEYGDGDVRAGYDPFSKNVFFTSLDKWNLHIKPEAKSEDGIPFISYHSWLPQRFIPLRYGLVSYDGKDLYKHNADGYQTFYGTTHTFDVGFLVNTKFQSSVLQSLDIFSEWIEHKAYGEHIYHDDVFFNKVGIYSNRASTGLLDVYYKNPENPNHSLIDATTSNRIEVAHISGTESYRLNGFKNIATGQPLIKWENNGVDYKLINTNRSAIGANNTFIKGKAFKVHLVNEIHTKYKILVQLNVDSQDKTTV